MNELFEKMEAEKKAIEKIQDEGALARKKATETAVQFRLPTIFMEKVRVVARRRGMTMVGAWRIAMEEWMADAGNKWGGR